MKKIFSAGFLLFIFTTISSHAQVRFGVRAGLNVAAWQGDAAQSVREFVQLTSGVAETRTRQGFHAGAYVNIPFGERFALEPGLFYSQKGYTMTGTFSSSVLEFLNARATVTNRAHYIDLPVLAKVYITEGFHVFAGPQVSYLVNNNLHTRASVLGFSVLNNTLDATGGFQRWDAGLTGGLGYRFGNGLNLQTGYDHGLRRLDENNNFNTYNRVVKVSLGYEF